MSLHISTPSSSSSFCVLYITTTSMSKFRFLLSCFTTTAMAVPALLLLTTLLVSSSTLVHGDQQKGVTYDQTSLIINGKRELLFSGSIHYPRSPPEYWPFILEQAKEGGLNVVQTYVFWNIHEPQQGKYNFEGPYDLVKFIKLVQEHGMYVILRHGPFVQAEFNHGGLPYWLREIPNIIFRSDNAPYKEHMERFVSYVVKMMKDNNLYASQGGPIILSQIENEYNTVQRAYRQLGDSYVQWAGNMALGLNTGVPWIMCKQKDAPGPIINTCNGRHCGDTFTGPNAPNKPYLWTENWTAQFRVFGDPPSQRSAEDTAYSVARWFSKNGTMVNYYMYHGGTNFDRTAASFVTTRYYDEAPLDEFGLKREPKFGHLRELHRVINSCQTQLLDGTPVTQNLGPAGFEALVQEHKETKTCVAFLTNTNFKQASTVNFRGKDYYLPARSISILPDCAKVVFNTATILSQHNSRNFVRSRTANVHDWKMFSEAIPSMLQNQKRSPEELYYLTKDTTDYAWYTTTINVDRKDLPMKKHSRPVLRVASLGHAMVAFINGGFVGSAHGSQIEKSFVLEAPVDLKAGVNFITFLASLIGLPDSGAYMEHRFAGPKGVSILGLNTGTLDLSSNGWGHQVGLSGQNIQVFTEDGGKKVNWQDASKGGPPVTWYKTTFETPQGKAPVAVRMTGMKKGMIWINGKSIGRYWMTYLSPLGEATQEEYHIPRSYLEKKDNLMVILEEEEANPNQVQILTVNRDTVCGLASENHPPNMQNSKFIAVVDQDQTAARLACTGTKKISAVQFASFGDPFGSCGLFSVGNCTASNTQQVVEKYCLGKASCEIPVDRSIFDSKNDACADIRKTLAVQVKCGK